LIRPLPASPLISRILRDFLFGCLIIFVIVTTVSLVFEYNARIGMIKSAIDQSLTYSKLPVARSLWNYDIAQVQANLEALTQIEGIYKAETYDERNQLVATAAKMGRRMRTDTVVSAVLTDESTKPLGTLRLYVSYTPVREHFWRGTSVRLLGEFAEIAVVAALLFILLHRNVIGYLITIARSVGQLELQNGFQPIELERGPHAADELDEVAQAINKFQRQIIEERTARVNLELKSRDLSAELTRMGRVATVQSLTSTIAHELNQPLGAILSNAEAIELAMLDKLPADDPLREVLADIASEARRAGNIIRNLRNLIEKRDMHLTILSLNTIVQEIIELVRFDVRWGAIRIDLQLMDPLPAIAGSTVQLQQVILNLVANARDAIHQAHIADGVITIRTQLDDARCVRLSVLDNGPGIPADKMNNIIQPFFTTKEGGTGMGLWIAQMIVEQHGGKLAIGNHPGGGAVFSFSLPAQQS